MAKTNPQTERCHSLRAPFFAYADNYLIDVKFGVIMDVEASRAIRTMPRPSNARQGPSLTEAELKRITESAMVRPPRRRTANRTRKGPVFFWSAPCNKSAALRVKLLIVINQTKGGAIREARRKARDRYSMISFAGHQQ